MANRNYGQIIANRRSLKIDNYLSLADLGFDGEWVTPYQITSRSGEGPVLVALHWLDEDSIRLNQTTLRQLGYLPSLRFNKVLDIALGQRNLKRPDIYVTQAFHLIPKGRSEQIPRSAIDRSFREVTQHELVGRKVIALGTEAGNACSRHSVSHVATCHPSRRGYSNEENGEEIARALEAVGF